MFVWFLQTIYVDVVDGDEGDVGVDDAQVRTLYSTACSSGSYKMVMTIKQIRTMIIKGQCCRAPNFSPISVQFR